MIGGMTPHSRRILRTVAVAILLAAAACRPAIRHTGDLDRIRETGELRVAVRPGFLASPVHTAGGVDQVEMLEQLAARLGVELRWVQARRNDQVAAWLEEGLADLAVHRFSPAGLRERGLVPSAAVDWVEDVVVASDGTGVQGFEDLGGLGLHLQGSYRELVAPGLEDLRRLGVRTFPVPEEVPLEEVVHRVRGGRYPLTVSDSGMLAALGESGLVQVGPLAEPRPLVWALRPGNPCLKEAVDGFLFAESVLARSTRVADCRDLPEIRRMRILRLITRNSPTTTTISRGGLEGFEYDLALGFARDLGVRLELVIPPPGADPLRWLEEGYGDVAALHEPLPLVPRGRFLATVPYRKVDLVVVARDDGELPAVVEDLSGRRVLAVPGAADRVALLPLDPPILVEALPPHRDALSALAAVGRGDARHAVVDRDLLRLELPNRPNLREGPVVIPGCELRWAVAPGSPALLGAADSFLRRALRQGLLRELELSELRPGGRWVSPKSLEIPEGALTPFDPLLQRAGRETGLDWRLLASLMYEESRFDPGAVGPGGSAGLFQFMPSTWRELGVRDPHDPAEAIPAAARYLSQLMDEFYDVPMADRVAMAIAAYNVGPRHVADARRLAREMGLDPDRWAGNVETALVLLDNPDVARRFPAGVCRCRRAVGYTRRILRRYQAYRELVSPLGSRGL